MLVAQIFARNARDAEHKDEEGEGSSGDYDCGKANLALRLVSS
jgi:hypothetical protein